MEAARGRFVAGIAFVSKAIPKRRGRPLGKFAVLLEARCRGAIDGLRIPVERLRTVVIATTCETGSVRRASVPGIDRRHPVVSLLHRPDGPGRQRSVERRTLRSPRVLLSIAAVKSTAPVPPLAAVKARIGSPATVGKAPVGHCRAVREIGRVIEEDGLSEPAQAPAQQPK